MPRRGLEDGSLCDCHRCERDDQQLPWWASAALAALIGIAVAVIWQLLS